MEIIDQKILHDSVRWPLSPEYGGDPLFKNTRLKKDTIAGDIVVANSAGDKLFVPQDLYAEDKAKWAEKGYEPIAVVVVPALHTDDGTARCCSVKYMSCETPEEGIHPITNDNYCYPHWGYSNYNDGHVPNITCVYSFMIDIPGTTTAASFNSNWYVPSDNERWNATPSTDPKNPDPIARYVRASMNGWVASPYGEDGISKNPAYYSGGSAGKLCMNGKEDTKAIIDYANTISTDWKTSQTINNAGNVFGCYPAAFCCLRYHTTGTSAGEWYLPAVGECGYFIARSNEIRKAFITIIDMDEFNPSSDGTLSTYNSYVLPYSTWTGSGILCSTEMSNTYNYVMFTSSGYMSSASKTNNYLSIAFIKI